MSRSVISTASSSLLERESVCLFSGRGALGRTGSLVGSCLFMFDSIDRLWKRELRSTSAADPTARKSG